MKNRNTSLPRRFEDFIFPGKDKYLESLKEKQEEDDKKKIVINYDLSKNQIKNFFDLSEFDLYVENLIKEKEKKEALEKEKN
jgi:hypothetical protein